MRLTDLQKEAEAFLAASGINSIEHPETLSTIPLSMSPLRLYDQPLFGVAEAQDSLWERLKDPEVIGPHHRSPTEWLPEARSVISYFLPFSKQIRKANRLPGITATEWLYGRFEGEKLNAALMVSLADRIRTSGGKAVAPSTDSRMAIVDLRANWSERHAAFVAGLGTFSLSRSMITSLGAAGRFGSLITDIYLEPTPRAYQGASDYCIDCGICIGRCPCQAIDRSGKDNAVCKMYLDQTTTLYAPRYGCGKCQTAVPCEGQIPHHSTE
jgi:epoxyqueuosine reductase